MERVGLLAGLLVLVLGSGAVAQEASSEPPPWLGGRVEMPEHGFALTVPDDWAVFDLTVDVESQLEAASGFLDPDRVDDLVRIILRLGFAELLPEYPTMVTDQPWTELSLTAGNRRHSVVDHGDAPLEFWAMAATVDAVVNEVEWDEPEGDDDDLPGDLGLPVLG